MADDIKSEGKCLYCRRMIAQTGMARHLATHLKEMEEEQDGPEKVSVIHLQVKAGKYFLQLLVKSTATFKDLDDFLRDIWLECCGHLSKFYTKSGNELKMKGTLKFVLEPGISFFYDYDFGTTTTLELKCQGLYHIKLKIKILLLSRNEPLKIICVKCGKKPAVDICLKHLYNNDGGFFCEDCAEIHLEECDSFDQMRMPVVNSPRMGECAYLGGIIDKERDGVYRGT